MNASESGAASSVNAVASKTTAAFVVLWLEWIGLLGAAMILGNVLAGHGQVLPTVARMGSSLVLVLAGWWGFAVWRRETVAPYALAIAVGMTLGAIGDFFNAGLLDFIPLEHPVLGGIAAFGLGHIAYIAGCIYLARKAGLTNLAVMLGAIVLWQLIAAVAWYFVVYLGTEARPLIYPGLIYSALLAGTTGVAMGLALQERRLTGLAVGAALFLLSDLILACGMFRGPFSHSTEAVWLTYSPGQMLIVFSILSAVTVLRTGAARSTAL
jgi:uncharacterized membrane protein YhhN